MVTQAHSVDEDRLHKYVMRHGKCRGTRIVNVPANVLLYTVRNQLPESDEAEAELQRRGTVVPVIEVSNHAIDRASQHCLDIWQTTRHGDEGLHAWLHRVACDAIYHGSGSGDERRYAGMCFTFGAKGRWPVLVTVRHIGRRADAVRQAKQVLKGTR